MMWQPISGRGRLESVYEWRVDVVSRVRVHVGLFLSLGLDAVPVWILDVHFLRVVLAARRIMGRVEPRSPGHEPSASIRFPQAHQRLQDGPWS